MDWNKWRWPSLSLFQRWITSKCSAFAPYSTGEDASLFLFFFCTFTFSDLNHIKKFCNLGCRENCSRLLSCSCGDFHFCFALSFFPIRVISKSSAICAVQRIAADYSLAVMMTFTFIFHSHFFWIEFHWTVLHWTHQIEANRSSNENDFHFHSLPVWNTFQFSLSYLLCTFTCSLCKIT